MSRTTRNITITKCDRCADETKADPIEWITIEVWEQADKNVGDSDTWDLCPRCKDAFVRFMANFEVTSS